MPDEDRAVKAKPLSEAAQARATVLALIRPRVDHVYANPMRGPDDLPMVSGDQDFVTIPHEWIGLLETWAASVLETVDELTEHEGTRRSNVEELRALLTAPKEG